MELKLNYTLYQFEEQKNLTLFWEKKENFIKSLTSFKKNLELLRDFVVLNYIAIYKIIKKRNKIMKLKYQILQQDRQNISEELSIQEQKIIYFNNIIDFNHILMKQPFYTSQELAKISGK